MRSTVASRTWFRARRVASWVPASNFGRSSANPGSPCPACAASQRARSPDQASKRAAPLGVLLRSAGDLEFVEVAHLVGNPEGLVRRKPEELLREADLVRGEGIAVRLGGVGQMRRRPADVAAQDEQVRLGVGCVGGVLERFADGGLEGVDVVRDLAQVVHPPAVGLEPLDRVVVVRQLGGAVDRDVVVVVEGEQAPQPEVPGERRRLVRDALHHAAVAQEHVGAVVADLTPEGRAYPALGEGHADRIGEALPERPRRHLDPRRVASTLGGPASGCPIGGIGAGRPATGRSR